MLLVTNRRPVVPLPLAHEGAVEPREVADRFFVREVAEALGERREAGLAADEDGRPDHEAGHYEDALTVREADLSMLRRISAPAHEVLIAQGNLAMSYQRLGRSEALRLRQKVYSGHVNLHGEEDPDTLREANNYAALLKKLGRFEEAKSLMRKSIPTAHRVLGETHDLTLTMRRIYAESLFYDTGATLDDLHEAVTTLEEIEPTTRRVFGGSHPLAVAIEGNLQKARSVRRGRDTPSTGSA